MNTQEKRSPDNKRPLVESGVFGGPAGLADGRQRPVETRSDSPQNLRDRFRQNGQRNCRRGQRLCREHLTDGAVVFAADRSVRLVFIVAVPRGMRVTVVPRLGPVTARFLLRLAGSRAPAAAGRVVAVPSRRADRDQQIARQTQESDRFRRAGVEPEPREHAADYCSLVAATQSRPKRPP